MFDVNNSVSKFHLKLHCRKTVQGGSWVKSNAEKVTESLRLPLAESELGKPDEVLLALGRWEYKTVENIKTSGERNITLKTAAAA
ncbi:hypothetical protein RUM44_002136 [Polyplax serrata]|uniref:Uncharacterized protein n=1 Tax=Polyplax serrata TaxID=468196 RepID=A0ABR1AM21_POLSC